MGEHIVGSVADIPEDAGLVVNVGSRSIGVFRVRDRFYALRNVCAHQGGPVCTGRLFPALRAEIMPSGKVREYYDYEQMVVACPWHGWEYDLATGKCLADESRRVAVYPTRIDGDQIMVTLPD